MSKTDVIGWLVFAPVSDENEYYIFTEEENAFDKKNDFDEIDPDNEHRVEELVCKSDRNSPITETVSLGDLHSTVCIICARRAEWGKATKKGPDGIDEAVRNGHTYCSKCLPNDAGNPDSEKWKFSYVDITTRGFEGCLNLFWGEYPLALVNNVYIASQIRKCIPEMHKGEKKG